MTEYNCPECKDTGVYQGLNSVEPCRACTPSFTDRNGKLIANSAGEPFHQFHCRPCGPQGGILVPPDIASAVISAWEENGIINARDNSTVHISITDRSVIENSVDYEEINAIGMIERKPVGPIHVSLSGVVYRQSEFSKICDAVVSREPVLLDCKFSDAESLGQRVRIVSFEHVEGTFSECNMELESVDA